jgi:CBS domain-containing protein
MLPWRTREAAMTALRARDLLTTEVAKVPPETPVAAIARMFAERGISAVAVTDAAETLLGIVTESDLIRRLADEDERRSGWLARLFDSSGAKAERYARSHGVNAGEVMTRRVVTADPEDSAAHLARLMEEHKVRRVLVTAGGRVLGLVSRSDLVRALVAQQQAPESDLSDDRIHRAVLDAMRGEPWADTIRTAVHVQNGVVEFYGFSRSEAVSRALCVLAENVPGVKGVVDHTSQRIGREPS